MIDVSNWTLAELREARKYLQSVLNKGDVAGHEFHGNQYTDGGGSSALATRDTIERDRPKVEAWHAQQTREINVKSRAQEFTSRLSKPDGGFSFDPRTGTEPKTGFMVSTNPEHEMVINSASHADAKTIAFYAQSHDDILSKPGMFMGGWHDPNTGKVYLDVSRRVDSKEEAESLARSHNQLSYFDIASGNSVSVMAVKGEGDGHPFRGNRYTGGIAGEGHETIGTVGAGVGPVPSMRINNIDEAVAALSHGQGVMFDKPEQAVTLLHKLSQMANEAKAKGEKAPNYDLCKVSVQGTNLFCSGNMNIPRDQMPQLKGIPLKGSVADSMPKNDKGEVDLAPAFKDYLASQGHHVEETDEYASRLRASQREMAGTKVGGMMEAMEAGKIKPESIFISKENYVIDGHHRWAATVGMTLENHYDLKMPVSRIDMPILEALAAANQFAISMGIPQAAVTKGAFRDAINKVRRSGTIFKYAPEDFEAEWIAEDNCCPGCQDAQDSSPYMSPYDVPDPSEVCFSMNGIGKNEGECLCQISVNGGDEVDVIDFDPTDYDTEKGLRADLVKGDVEGHEFHGNRWTGGIGGSSKLELHKMTPAEIDTEWQKYQVESMNALRNYNNIRSEMNRYQKAGWKTPDYLVTRQEKALAILNETKAAEQPFQQEWTRRGGWSQYQLCQSDGGHVHESQCQTLTPGKTLVSLQPQLSGLDHKGVVAAIGYKACTHCFPDAPTHPAWIMGAKEDAAKQDAKNATKCPGGGKWPTETPQARWATDRYGVCPDCGKVTSRSPNGYIRAHAKPKAQKRTDADLIKGDVDGHEFHGNRFTGGIGGGELSTSHLGYGNLGPKSQATISRSLAKFSEEYKGVANTDLEHMRQNARDIMARAKAQMSPQDFQKAANWYKDEGDKVKSMGASMQGPGAPKGFTPQQSTAICAAMSPQNPWDNSGPGKEATNWPNLNCTHDVMSVVAQDPKLTFTEDQLRESCLAYNREKGWSFNEEMYNKLAPEISTEGKPAHEYTSEALARCMPRTQGYIFSNTADAIDIARGRNPEEVLKTPKIRSFYNNFMNPKGDDTTIDVHMARALLSLDGKSLLSKDHAAEKILAGSRDKAANNPGNYPVFGDTLRAVAHELGMVPNAIQAVVWIQWRNEHTDAAMRKVTKAEIAARKTAKEKSRVAA